jgi:hypothetical protein
MSWRKRALAVGEQRGHSRARLANDPHELEAVVCEVLPITLAHIRRLEAGTPDRAAPTSAGEQQRAVELVVVPPRGIGEARQPFEQARDRRRRGPVAARYQQRFGVVVELGEQRLVGEGSIEVRPGIDPMVSAPVDELREVRASLVTGQCQLKRRVGGNGHHVA